MRSLTHNFAARLACTAVCAALCALCVARGVARADATTAPAADSSYRFGIVRFTPPAGWQSEQQRDATVFVSPDSTADRQAAIVVLITAPLGQSFDFRARFDKAVASAADAHPLTEHGLVVSGTSRQGCDTLEQTFAFNNAAGQIVRGRLLAARVGDRLAAFCYLATGEDLFQKHASDVDDLLSTVRFEGLPATTPATTQAAEPAAAPVTRAELQAIEREKAELQKRVADLESKERGLNAPLANEPNPTTEPAGAIDVTDQSRAGASLRAHFPKRTRLILTFTPILPAGAEVRVLFCDIDRLPGTAHFTGLSPGSYRLTARAVTPDDKQWPLKVTTKAAPTASDWADSVQVDPAKGPSIGVTDVPK